MRASSYFFRYSSRSRCVYFQNRELYTNFIEILNFNGSFRFGSEQYRTGCKRASTFWALLLFLGYGRNYREKSDFVHTQASQLVSKFSNYYWKFSPFTPLSIQSTPFGGRLSRSPRDAFSGKMHNTPYTLGREGSVLSWCHNHFDISYCARIVYKQHFFFKFWLKILKFDFFLHIETWVRIPLQILSVISFHEIFAGVGWLVF